MVSRSTGKEASDVGLYAFCTVSVRDNASPKLRTKSTSRHQQTNFLKRMNNEFVSHKSGRNDKFGLFTDVLEVWVGHQECDAIRSVRGPQ